jgi:hydrogenase expression/formation protein HypD
MMYSPSEAVDFAMRHPDKTAVIAAVGFETTIPAYALALEEARAVNLTNIKLVTALKTVVPALKFVAESEIRIGGFLCPGHVSVITGAEVYRKLAEKYGRPFVIAGFSGEHILAAIYAIIKGGAQISKIENSGDYLQGDYLRKEKPAVDAQGGQSGKGYFSNLYGSAVRDEGNTQAQNLITKYFETGSAVWRGIGTIENSGYYLRDEYSNFEGGGRDLNEDAALPQGCRCADVITGRIDPPDCPLFNTACRPETPCGPCMVSAEGACGIWQQGGNY